MSEHLATRPEIMLIDGILKNDANMTRWALKNGVNPDLRDREDPKSWRLMSLEIRGSFPLYEVAYRGAKRFGGRGDSIIAQQLVDAGASVRLTNDKGYTALHQAAVANNAGVTQLLIDRSADVNVQSLRGYTPLHTAVYGRSMEALGLLLMAGANPFVTNGNGLDVIAYAAKLGRHDALAFLQAARSGAVMEAARRVGAECLHSAAWTQPGRCRP